MPQNDQDARAIALISHGTSSRTGRVAVSALVDAVARRLPTRRVVAGFVDVQRPDAPTVLAHAGPAVVVPLLLSAGYHVRVDLRGAVAAAEVHRRAADPDAPPAAATVLTPSLGPDARLVRLLAARLRQAGLRPGDRVVLGAAGSSDPRAVADCLEIAARLGGLLGREVGCGFLSAATPRLADAVAVARGLRPSARVVVASYLLAPGHFADLVSATGADVVTAPLLCAGEPVPDELVAVVLDRITGASPRAASRRAAAGRVEAPPELVAVG